MCDTFVALGGATADGAVIFGKNSDREPNEAQALEYHAPAEHSRGEGLRCTYLTIPQVRATHGVLLSRPFWMWGAEMGANDRGVVIGNEAVWTKMPLNKGKGLTGMDLLRLALERGRNAEAALEVIIQLLADFGQGGICGYEDKKMAYHNSFIIADPEEAWVLETAGPLWAAKRVKGYYSISNGLTIGGEMDRRHPDLISHARKKGWVGKGKDFHFARAYSDWFYTRFSASSIRRHRSLCLLEERAGGLDIRSALQVLRDHGAGSASYRPDGHWLGSRICAHAGNSLTRHATQTVGSMVAHLKPQEQVYWVTGTAAPCTGIFKPVWMQGKVLPGMGAAPGGKYDSASLWWHHERLHRLVLQDYEDRLAAYRKERDELESAFIDRAEKVEEGGREALTALSFRSSREAGSKWAGRVAGLPVRRRPGRLYRKYWAKQNARAGMRLP